jgi:hypothetical protein
VAGSGIDDGGGAPVDGAEGPGPPVEGEELVCAKAAPAQNKVAARSKLTRIGNTSSAGRRDHGQYAQRLQPAQRSKTRRMIDGAAPLW